MKKLMILLVAVAFTASGVYAQPPLPSGYNTPAKKFLWDYGKSPQPIDNNDVICADVKIQGNQENHAVAKQCFRERNRDLPEENVNAVMPANPRISGKHDKNASAKQNFWDYAK
jgi:hypothetical protein